MRHFIIDGFQGYRSRFDHIQLIQEILEEIPDQLNLRPAMPAFLLPYYNGVLPEDCGVSAFVLLEGGHFTLHTFSFREAYFADLVSPTSFDPVRLRTLLETALPCAITTSNYVERTPNAIDATEPDVDADFGPHLLLDIEEYQGPRTMDALFTLFDRLPEEIGMTPIMRPYVLHGSAQGQPVTSVMTMIAESHVSLHVFQDEARAYFDIFSCRFFNRDTVVPRIKAQLPGRHVREVLLARGSKYRLMRTERVSELTKSRRWLKALTPSGQVSSLRGRTMTPTD